MNKKVVKGMKNEYERGKVRLGITLTGSLVVIAAVFYGGIRWGQTMERSRAEKERNKLSNVLVERADRLSGILKGFVVGVTVGSMCTWLRGRPKRRPKAL